MYGSRLSCIEHRPSSLPPSPRVSPLVSSPPPSAVELPSYDQVMPDGGGGGGDDDDEPVMDENERIALQEQEDERMAREMFEREQGGSSSEVHVHVCVWCLLVCVCGEE